MFGISSVASLAKRKALCQTQIRCNSTPTEKGKKRVEERDG